MCAAAFLAVSLSLAGLRAGDKADLERVVPVPANQPIPLGDFFRPGLLQEPKLSPTGTAIAAVVTAGEDNHLLLIYDVKTQKYQVLGRRGDTDVVDFAWLTDKRLVFQLSSQKLYGIGFFGVDVGDVANPYPILQYYGTQLISVPWADRTAPLVWNSINALQSPWKDMGASIVNPSKLSRANGIDLSTTNGEEYWAHIQTTIENDFLHDRSAGLIPADGDTTGYIADKDGNLEFATTIRTPSAP